MSADEDEDWLAQRAELVEAVGRGLFTGKEVMAELGISELGAEGWELVTEWNGRLLFKKPK